MAKADEILRRFERFSVIESEINQLADSYKVMKGIDSAEFSDLEAVMEREEMLGKVELLKQVMTDPDYAAREQFLGKATPLSLSPI